VKTGELCGVEWEEEEIERNKDKVIGNGEKELVAEKKMIYFK